MSDKIDLINYGEKKGKDGSSYYYMNILITNGMQADTKLIFLTRQEYDYVQLHSDFVSGEFVYRYNYRSKQFEIGLNKLVLNN